MDPETRNHLLSEAEQNLARIARESGRGSPEWRSADKEFLALQRRTAEEAGLPFAVPIDLGVKWDAGAPMPVLISAVRTMVTFFRADTQPSGGVPRMRESDDLGVAVVRFKEVTSVKMGSPNDEVLHGHPLWGSGLEPYEAHLVRSSPWIEELQRTNSVHRQYKVESWTDQKHYVFVFHDETLECVASDIDVQIEYRTLPQILPELVAEATG